MKIILNHVITLFVAAGLVTSLGAGCASTDVNESNSAEAAFKAAMDYEKDERYEEAITKFTEVKNKHPYSRFAVESELRIADIHYKRENFIESQTAYQLFKDFHPKHAKIDYVTHRLAMSYFNQLPSTIDRDLSPAHKAIQYFNEVVNSFPTSEYVKEATEKRDESLKMLAEKEAYIANFYFIREKYESALRRYEGLLAKYPNRGQDEEALYRAGVSAFETSNPGLGKKYINELLARFPNGSHAGDGRRALEKYGSR
jgi:outer membrane protein assembly factor BamD